MKNLLIISTHSFVDLITNSSSELFICDTDKTLDTIKDILTDLAEKHNISHDQLFGSIIKEPSICQYTFDINQYPGAEEYKSLCRYCFDDSKKNQLVKDTDEAWYQWESENKIKYPQSPYKYGTEEYKLNQDTWYKEVHTPFLQSKEYKKYQNKRSAAYKKIHKKLDKRVKEVSEEMLKWAFKLNNIPYNPVPRPKGKGLYSLNAPIWVEWRKKHDANVEFNNAQDEFETAASYGYTLQKGNILIESQGDNSIPWDLMDEITAVFSAQRIHLG